jgi:hypothetical protein
VQPWLGMINRRVAQAVVLAGLATVAYASAIDNPFVYDDLSAISGNLLVRTPRVAWTFFAGGPASDGFAERQLRPLPMLSFAANYGCTGGAPRWFRLTNLALHIVICLLAAAVLRRLLTIVPLARGRPPLGEVDAEWAAFIGATMLAIHPTHSLVVLLVWKRATLMAAGFSLLALWCLLRLRGLGPTRPDSSRAAATLRLAMYGSHLLALLSKETAVVLPALLLLVDRWPRGPEAPRSPPPRATVALHAPLWLLSAVFLAVALARASPVFTLAPLAYLLVQMKVVWFYLATVIAPPLLSAAYSVHLPSGADPLAIAGGLALLAAIVASVLLARRAPLATLSALWALVALLPTSSVFPIPLLVDEDRVYLSAVLPWGVLGALVVVAARRNRTARAVVVGVMLGAGVAATLFTLGRGILWSSPPALWLDARLRYPNSYQANANLCGTLLGEPGMRPQALAVCREALYRFPGSGKIRAGFARLLAESGRTSEAEGVLADGLRADPDSAECLRAAGHLAWARARPAAAIGYYERALRTLALDDTVALYLASSYAEVGRIAEATGLANQLRRWPPPASPAQHLDLLKLFHAIGWDGQACAGYAKIRGTVQATPRLRESARSLEAACPLPR